MKLSRSTVRLFVTAVIAVGLLSAFAIPAFAFEGTPTVLMDGKDISLESRGVWWFNTLTPAAQFGSINVEGLAPTTGFWYNVDRSRSTIPTLGSDWTISGGPLTEQRLDIAGLGRVFPAPLTDGVTRIEEGIWYIHARSYIATMGLSSETTHGVFGIDLTRPAPVLGLDVGPRRYTETMRRRITWRDLTYERTYDLFGPYDGPGGYDALSGDADWVLTVNGETPYVWHRYLASPYGVQTIETGLHSGVNTISVQVMDHAGNVSVPVYGYILIDSDWPKVNVVSPAQSSWLRGKCGFSVNATDGAGFSAITFKIDGVVKQTSTTKQTYACDTTRLAAGHHVLQVVVADKFGHTRSASRDFYVDNTAIRLSSMSDAPDPFYPIIVDGVRDKMRATAYMNDRAQKVYFEVFDPAGNLVRQYQWSNVSAGWISGVWDGSLQSGGRVKLDSMPGSATFHYRFRVCDQAGNWTTTGMGSTEIRNYEIIPISAGSVKIVAR